jgi:hypothetical protein
VPWKTRSSFDQASRIWLWNRAAWLQLCLQAVPCGLDGAGFPKGSRSRLEPFAFEVDGQHAA